MTTTDIPGDAAVDDHNEPSKAMALVNKILSVGVDGAGPFKGAREFAEEHMADHPDPEEAVRRIIRTHVRLVGATGFATGLGGVFVMPVTIPTDLVTFYALAARCSAAVTNARGYDISSDEVRSLILISLLGAGGAAVVADVGINVGNKVALSALRSLPGSVLIASNKRVGFRLLTKFGEKGAINLVKVLPLAGGGVGAAVNVTTMRGIGKYTKRNLPARAAA